MSPKPSVPFEVRYTITDQGRQAIEEAQRCICDIRLAGVTLFCPDCGTVYGSIKDGVLGRPKAQRWSKAR